MRLLGLAGSVGSLISRFSLNELKTVKFALVFGPPDALSLVDGGLFWIGRKADEPELRLICWMGRIGPVSAWVPVKLSTNKSSDNS